MDIVTCPHCLTSVLPSPAGICPACRRNVIEHRQNTDSFVTARIECGEPLPPVCTCCGSKANHWYRLVIREPESAAGESPHVRFIARVVKLLTIWCYGLVAVVVERWLPKPGLRFSLPRCESCIRTSPVHTYANFAENWARLVVHRDFESALAEERRLTPEGDTEFSGVEVDAN